MTKLTQDRIYFIELLHEAFFKRKGYGAFAYISISDVMCLFESYLESKQTAGHFINNYVRSV